MARDRLANPEEQRTSWLATTRPDGRPHLMPVIGFWIDGAIHIVAGEGTRKSHNLAADGRCVIATSSTTLPSLDIVVEGGAHPLTEGDAVRHIAEVLSASGWPLEAKGTRSRPERPNRRTVNFHELQWTLGRHAKFVEHFLPLTFLGNHDVTRIASQITDSRHWSHAVALLGFLPGVPCVYYGDEFSLEAVKEHSPKTPGGGHRACGHNRSRDSHP